MTESAESTFAQRSDNGSADKALIAAVALLAQEMKEDRQGVIAERRRARRGTWLRWGIFILILLGIVIFTISRAEPPIYDHIARVDIVGAIVSDPDREAMFKEIAEDDSVKALLVRIDSPGGTMVGGEVLFQNLRMVAKQKPVVALMGEVAASAAYMTAVGADRIIARGSTITASVGVIFTAPNFYGALDAIGVEVVEIKSGVNKAEPSPFQALEGKSHKVEQEFIEELFEWFVELVVERRSLDQVSEAIIRDGRVLTGHRAFEIGLVDEIGSEREALAWLKKEKGIDGALPKRDWGVEDERNNLIGILLDNLLGRSATVRKIEEAMRGPALISLLR
jgi:protease-4